MKPLAPATLPRPVEAFLTELALDHAFGVEVVTPFHEALCALDREADDNPEALKMLQCLAVICGEVSHPPRERLEAVRMVLNAPKGKITVTIKRAAA
jgi:hypothetical protein